jgi:diacylglycerol kinase (ATP)
MSATSIPVVAPAFGRPPRAASRWSPAGRHVLLVANGSASGLGRSRDLVDGVERLLRQRGLRVETQLTTSLEELAASAPGLYERRVALLGGDGTVHAAANLPLTPPELAILPAGRANNIARALGVPLDLEAAAALAAEGRPRPLDLISATSKETSYLAVEGVSVGLHALARAGYRAPNSADTNAAIRSALRAARGFEGVPLCVSSDGTAEMLTVGQLFVANLPLFAFGLRVAPAARPDDGLLDVVALPWEGPAQILPTIARLRRGTHLARRGARTWTAGRVRIATRGRSPVIADTTNLGPGPVRLEAAPSALWVVAP